MDGGLFGADIGLATGAIEGGGGTDGGLAGDMTAAEAGRTGGSTDGG